MRSLAPFAAIVAIASATALPGTAGGADRPIQSQAKRAGVDAKIVRGVLRVTGDRRNNRLTLRLRKKAKNTLEIDVSGSRGIEFRFDRRRFKRILVDGGKGNDTVRISDAGGAFTHQERTTINGGSGNDNLTGGRGNETFGGSTGNDTVDGNGGKDSAKLGAGDDSYRSDTGDGSDKVRGEAGADTVTLNGSGAADDLATVAAGSKLRLLRAGVQAVDADDVETAALNPGGGADALTVNDLAGTDVTRVSLLTTGSNGFGDNAPDAVVVNGSAGPDTLLANGSDTGIEVSGLAATVVVGPHVSASTGLQTFAGDSLTVNGLGGNDAIAAVNPSNPMVLVADGGGGDDVLASTAGLHRLAGGDDNDTLVAGPGSTGATLEGGNGGDRLAVNGSGEVDDWTASPVDGHVRVDRGGTSPIDATGVEDLELNPLGGADRVTFNDLGGSGVASAAVDLAGSLGETAGDAQGDSVVVNGTDAPNGLAITGAPGAVAVGGLSASIAVRDAEPSADRLTVEGHGGGDTIDANGLAAGSIGLTLDGGAANDVLGGSQGDDLIRWDAGEGNDVIEGRGGSDRVELGGSDANENYTVAPLAGRAKVVRGPDTVADANDVETVDVNPGAGADTVAAEPMTGTEVTRVNVGPGADGQADAVLVIGTAAADTIAANDSGQSVVVTGLTSVVSAAIGEPSDSMAINSLNGEDVIDATGIPAGLVALTLNGGVLSDVLLGSAGNDGIIGDDGNDVALMGAGNDTFRWDPGDGSDTVEGQAGSGDAMLFNGSNASEIMSFQASGGRVLFTRNVAAITMDLNDVERIDLNTFGAADAITVGDMSGTDLTETNISLAATLGGNTGDSAADNVTVTGTNGDDVVVTGGGPAGTTTSGLRTLVRITGAEAANDRLTLNALVGDDVIDASGVDTNAIQLTLNGGSDDDVLIGGDGNDTLNGDAGADTLNGGPGTDTLNGGGNPGDVENQ